MILKKKPWSHKWKQISKWINNLEPPTLQEMPMIMIQILLVHTMLCSNIKRSTDTMKILEIQMLASRALSSSQWLNLEEEMLMTTIMTLLVHMIICSSTRKLTDMTRTLATPWPDLKVPKSNRITWTWTKREMFMIMTQLLWVLMMVWNITNTLTNMIKTSVLKMIWPRDLTKSSEHQRKIEQ